MKPFTKNLHGRNHRYSAPESKNVPKSAGDRKGSRSPVRQEADKEIEKEIEDRRTMKITEVTNGYKLVKLNDLQQEIVDTLEHLEWITHYDYLSCIQHKDWYKNSG